MPESLTRSGSRPVAPKRPTRPSRQLLVVTLTAALVTGVLGLAAPAAAAPLKTARVTYASAIEPLAGYQAQTTCSPTAKRGVADFARRLLAAYPTTRSLGIVRACSAGGRSEHKEGRAFDWGGLNAASATDRARVGRFLKWLFKKDRHGNRYAMARRLGIQYVIWNRKIWGSYNAESGWRRYRGASPHRDHVHISFTWAGARGKTSFWTGKVGNVGAAPSPRPTPTLPGGTPPPRPTTPTLPPPRPEPVRAPSLLPGAPLVDETLVVPASGTGSALTSGALQAGQEYLVEVSGTYRYGPSPDQLADAECSRTATSAGWRRDRSVHSAQPGSDHLDLYVDGADLGSDPDVDAGGSCDVRTHTYRDRITADRTGRVSLALWDPTTAADNAGGLTVRVMAMTPVPAMDFEVPATAAAGVTGSGALEAGATYLVTVAGTVAAGGGVTSDAECSSADSGQSWLRDRSVDPADPGADHLDVLVDRRDVTFRPVSDADGDGCDATSHTYRTTVTPSSTATLNLRVDDPFWSDNVGALTVSVRKVEAVTGPETVVVDAAAADVETARIYPAGRPLRLTAVGAYTFAPGVDADAECSATTADATWRTSRTEVVRDGRAHGDVTVDGRTPDWLPTSGRCDPTTHTYTWTYTPSRAGPLALGVLDWDRSDNAGTVAVTVEPVG